jgi:hypothetical protein
MKTLFLSHTYKLFILVAIVLSGSCKKLKDYNQEPELESLQQGLKTSVAVGYCVSVASAAFKGQELPDNVLFDNNSGLIYIKIDAGHPLPFNNNVGDIVIACHWSNNGGVMSVLFGNIDILGGTVKLYGLYLVPFVERQGENVIRALFARQDIILGNGSDTILDLSNITLPVFNAEMERLNSEEPSDVFAVVKQNVWFVNVDQNNTFSNVYDDNITINGGGQIAEVKGASGGIIYHALINTKVNYSVCSLNPVSGYALSQNFKAGGAPYIDLGNSLLRFHENCDGMVHVELSTGKYIGFNNKDIALDLQ